MSAYPEFETQKEQLLFLRLLWNFLHFVEVTELGTRHIFLDSIRVTGSCNIMLAACKLPCRFFLQDLKGNLMGEFGLKV